MRMTSSLRAGQEECMKRIIVRAILLSLAATNIAALANQPQPNQPQKKERAKSRQASVYYPPPDDWQRKAPEEVGMDAPLLEKALAFAKTQESTVPRDFSTQVETFGAILGPLPKQRGESSLIVIRHGYIV